MASPLTLEALEALDAIDRKGSFAAAAASLNKVPSAISYTVQKLEQDLGITLFQRQGRQSVMTAAAKLLVEQGRPILRANNELAAAAKQVATGWEPRLRIAVDTIIPEKLIFPLLSEFYELHPDIDIELSTEVLGGSWETLMEDRVDLVVGAPDTPPAHKGIRSISWQTTESVFVAPPDHPLCEQATPLSNEVISEHRAVIAKDSSRHQAPWTRGVLNKERFLLVPTMKQKIQAHCHGLGVGFAPLFRVRDELTQGALIQLEIAAPLPPLQLYLAWKISNRGQALNWFVDKIKLLNLDT